LNVRHHSVPPTARGQRLDAFLASLEPELSRSRIKSLIESGEVTLDGAPARPSRLLRGGETITVAVEPARPVVLEAESIELSILFEDADIVAIDKPAGLVVHPGAGNPSGTLVNALLGHCTDLAGIGGELRPGIVHRLDKDTSGCIVVAKNEAALSGLQAQFKGRSVEKVYLALVHGMPAASGRFETLHGRHPTDRMRFSGRVKSGRPAVTEWEVAEGFGGAALVRVELLTGRTHQIRMHFSEAGHPLLADELYGGVRRERRLPPDSVVRRAAERIGRQALHAHQLAFDHPRTGARISLEAPLPPDFAAALELLRG
jgi:23S rRNA pseudouridine1911/1915/1917 synthase